MLALMTVMCFDGVMRLSPLSVSDEDRVELERRVRSRTLAARDAQRARLVVMAADGCSNRAIGETIGMHYNQVAVWRRRSRELGVGGLAREARRGRPVVYDHDDVLMMVHLVTTEPPDGYARWSCELIAA